MFEAALLFLKTYGVELGSVAALVAIATFAFKPVLSLISGKKEPDTLTVVKETIKALSAEQSKDGPKLTVPELIRIRREMKADLEAELATADQPEKEQLRARIAELEKQIADPESALAEAQRRIADLEARLERSGNNIGGDRLAKARAALERGDFSIADEVFAEIEDRRELEAKEAARAAYGRGEIAEEQVRWLDAAEHYSRAARLDPSYETLLKAGEFFWRAGRHTEAIWQEEQLVKIAKAEFGAKDAKSAIALNNLAFSYNELGRYVEAEPLLRQALEIDRKTLGTDHPDYAIHLNNLGTLLSKTGQYGEAEPLCCEALAVLEAALGAEHPHTVTARGNLETLLAKHPN